MIKMNIITVLTLLLLVVFSLLMVFIFIAPLFRKHNVKQENFTATSKNLDTLDTDIKNLLTTVVGKDVVDLYSRLELGLVDQKKILGCIRQKMSNAKIPLDKFNMDGDRMDTPILKMYQEDRKLYDILAECNFLRMIGRTLGLIMYVTYIQGYSKVDEDTFGNCMNKFGDFSDINIWKNIGTVKDEFIKCMSDKK